MDKNHSLSPGLTPCRPVSGAPKAVALRPVSTQWGQRLSWVTRKILGIAPSQLVLHCLPFLGWAMLLQAEKRQRRAALVSSKPSSTPQAVSHPSAWRTSLLPCPRAGRGARVGRKQLQHLGGA